MPKYIVMFETDNDPEPGNCDECEFNCPHYMSCWEKQAIWEMDPRQCLHHLSDFYCPIRAVVDVNTFLKWKEEHPDLGEPKKLEDYNDAN